jgi:hypothetical protein
MGMYELMEGKEVNGRGVWQIAGGKGWFMYYGSTKEWYISGKRAKMEAGKASGWMRVASTALTPDQITETWQVYDIVAKAFVDAPKVRARMCSVEEKQCTDILLEGQQQGDHQHDCMGMYELMEGKKVNGRGVWQMAGGMEYFMYYGSRPGNYFGSIKKWTIGGRASMEAGKGTECGMRVASTALTPDQITKTWQVFDDDEENWVLLGDPHKCWVDAPKVRARMYSAEQKRAAAEKLEQERQQAMAAARQVRDIRMLDCR